MIKTVSQHKITPPEENADMPAKTYPHYDLNERVSDGISLYVGIIQIRFRVWAMQPTSQPACSKLPC